jgi:hypothetical protein
LFGDGFEQRTGPDGLTRVITRSPGLSAESVLVEAFEAELLVFRRWEQFHERVLGFAGALSGRQCYRTGETG